MARCNTCSAPLPPDVGVCEYCGSQTDIDLKGIHEYTVNKPESTRICPDCHIPLQTLDLQVEGKFFIERCDTCLGLFFAPFFSAIPMAATAPSARPKKNTRNSRSRIPAFFGLSATARARYWRAA